MPPAHCSRRRAASRSISNNAGFAGGFTSANLLLATGTFSGSNAAVASGSVNWSGGSLSGSWQVEGGQTLAGVDGGDKNFSGVGFVNLGTVQWQSAARAGFVSSSIDNAGLFDVQSDADLTYVGGSASSFANSGTLRKSAGSGSTVIRWPAPRRVHVRASSAPTSWAASPAPTP